MSGRSAARNKAISEGQRRAWADPVIRARRSAAILKALNDPLAVALMRAKAFERSEKKRMEGA